MTLAQVFFESYSSILLVVGVIAAVIFAMGTYFILRLTRPPADKIKTINLTAARKRAADQAIIPDAAQDVTAIAGDDVMATQLDLARAYIETGKNQFARIILKTVLREGSTADQEEAQRLLGSI